MSSRNHHTPCHRKVPTCCTKKARCVDHSSTAKNNNCRNPCSDDPCAGISSGGGIPTSNNNNGGDQPLRNHLSEALLRQSGGGGSQRNLEAEVDRLVECARAWSEKEKFKLKQYYEEEMAKVKRAVIQEFTCAMERDVIAPLKSKLCDNEKEIQRLRAQLKEGGQCPPQREVTETSVLSSEPKDAQNNRKSVMLDINVVDKALEKARKSNRQLQNVIKLEKRRKSTRSMSVLTTATDKSRMEEYDGDEGSQRDLEEGVGEEANQRDVEKAPRKDGTGTPRRDKPGGQSGVKRQGGVGTPKTLQSGELKARSGGDVKGESRGDKEREEDMAELGLEEEEGDGLVEEAVEDIMESLLQAPDLTEETRLVVNKVKDLTAALQDTKTFTEEEISDLIKESELAEAFKRQAAELQIENEELKRRIAELLKQLQNMQPTKGTAEEENMLLRQRIQELEGERTRGSLQTELNLLKQQLEELWAKNEEEKARSDSQLQLIPEEEGEIPDGGVIDSTPQSERVGGASRTGGSTPGSAKSPAVTAVGSKKNSTKSQQSPDVTKGPSAKTLSGKDSGGDTTQKSRKGSADIDEQKTLGGASEGAGQKTPEGASEGAGQKTPEGASEGAGQKTPGGASEGAGQRTPGGASEGAGQKTPGGASEVASQRSPQPAESPGQRSPAGGSEKTGSSGKSRKRSVTRSLRSLGLSARSVGEITGPFEDNIKLLLERIAELEDSLSAMVELELRLKELEEQAKEMEQLKQKMKEMADELEELRAKECPVCPIPSETELKATRKKLEEAEAFLEKKAKEFEELSDQLKDLQRLNEELSQSVASFKTVAKKHEELESLHAQVLEEKRRKSVEAKALAEQVSKLADDYSAALNQIDQLRSDLSNAEEMARRGDELKRQLEGELTDLRVKLEGEMEDLRRRLQGEISDLMRKLDENNNNVEELKRKLREKEAQLEELLGRNAALQDEADIARKRLEDALKEKENLDRELDTVRRHCEQIQNDLMRQLREQQKKCSEACDALSKRGLCILEHEKKCMNVTSQMEKDNEDLRQKLGQMQDQLDAMVSMEQTTRALHGQMEEFHRRAQERSRELEELKKLPETCDLKNMQSTTSSSVLPSPLYSLPDLPTPSQIDYKVSAVSGASGGGGGRRGSGSEECKLLSAQLQDVEKEKENLGSELQGKLQAVEDINRQLERLQTKDRKLREDKDKACSDDK